MLACVVLTEGELATVVQQHEHTSLGGAAVAAVGDVERVSGPGLGRCDHDLLLCVGYALFGDLNCALEGPARTIAFWMPSARIPSGRGADQSPGSGRQQDKWDRRQGRFGEPLIV